MIKNEPISKTEVKETHGDIYHFHTIIDKEKITISAFSEGELYLEKYEILKDGTVVVYNKSFDGRTESKNIGKAKIDFKELRRKVKNMSAEGVFTEVRAIVYKVDMEQTTKGLVQLFRELYSKEKIEYWDPVLGTYTHYIYVYNNEIEIIDINDNFHIRIDLKDKLIYLVPSTFKTDLTQDVLSKLEEATKNHEKIPELYQNLKNKILAEVNEDYVKIE